ncbi:14497_t:CDS:2, partial [Cetraspora pellucida]
KMTDESKKKKQIIKKKETKTETDKKIQSMRTMKMNPDEYATEKIDVKQLFKFTNEERTKIISQLVEAAQKYAEYLARNKIYDHIPNARKKINGIIWGEILGHSYENEKEVIKSWMNSP